MRALLTTVSVVLAGLSFTLLNACVAEEAQDGAAVVKPDLAEQIRGEWVIYRDTPNGRYMTIKKHLGHQTEVTTYDPGNTAIHSHRSEYQLDVSGTAPIFRYRNREVLVGPDAGTRDDRNIWRVRRRGFCGRRGTTGRRPRYR